MTSNLRNLLWAAALLCWLVLLLDWRDEVIKLRPERVRLEQLRAKEQSALWNVNWKDELQNANLAKKLWLERIPVVEQTGVFRAQALESIGDLCKQIQAACQVGALGENLVAPGKTASQGIAGLVTTGVRVTVPLQDSKLELLLNVLENDTVLRRIDKLSTRAGRLTLDVQTFGRGAMPQTSQPLPAASHTANPGADLTGRRLP